MRISWPTFAEFYPYYPSEHRDRTRRPSHFADSSLAPVALALVLDVGDPRWMLAPTVAGHGPAWVGYVVFERNPTAALR